MNTLVVFNVFVYVLALSLHPHSFNSNFLTRKYISLNRMQEHKLTGKNSGISTLCLELPVNPRNRVALYLTIQCQTLMQRTSHILRARGNPWDCTGITHITDHTDMSSLLMLVC
jgi:hypothetical protein